MYNINFISAFILLLIPGVSFLLKYRLNHIKNNYPDTEIHLDTSQHTYRFFEKFGFNVKQISKNGYGVGLDRYDMFLK